MTPLSRRPALTAYPLGAIGRMNIILAPVSVLVLDEKHVTGMWAGSLGLVCVSSVLSPRTRTVFVMLSAFVATHNAALFLLPFLLLVERRHRRNRLSVR
ncbi:hypothetical protein OF83DRAFT_697968 [Amylostereum chailletii]|nr:hypothetical protein OF83DRAFT_697968 [Amylostereum chailletii]